MNDLIEALQILVKYVKEDVHNPTHCERDELMICCVDPKDVSDEHKKRLDELGFFAAERDGDGMFISFRFGSC